MILPRDYSPCKGTTSSGANCHMKQNCKRYLSYTIDNEVYVPVINAPDCIEHTPLECPLKIVASDKGEGDE